VKRLEAGLLRHRLAFALIATLLLFILAMLPFAIGSVLQDVLGPPQSLVFPIERAPADPSAPARLHLHIAVTGIEEVQRLATLRISGHRICRPSCPWSAQLILFSIDEDDEDAEGLPPSAAVTLQPSTVQFAESVQLPIQGQPLSYPFDTFHLQLGIVLQRVFPDGTVQTLAPTEAPGQLLLTVQDQMPRFTMDPPAAIDPARLQVEGHPHEYLYVRTLSFARPLYLRVLAVLLVLLIAAAAAYAVFLRPLQALIVDAGGLVLGVWGIRAILVPSNLNVVSAVDLALSVVILFLLGAITVRMLVFFHERSRFHLPGGKPPEA
jgi:hypothetical protein